MNLLLFMWTLMNLFFFLKVTSRIKISNHLILIRNKIFLCLHRWYQISIFHRIILSNVETSQWLLWDFKLSFLFFSILAFLDFNGFSHWPFTYVYMRPSQAKGTTLPKTKFWEKPININLRRKFRFCIPHLKSQFSQNPPMGRITKRRCLFRAQIYKKFICDFFKIVRFWIFNFKYVVLSGFQPI